MSRENNMEKPSAGGRLQAPCKQWIKFAVWGIVYILFVIWVGNLWWLLLLPLIFDAFITKFVPWTWWHRFRTTSPWLYKLMSWVDAIVFALVAVYFINQYLFQNYQIPSSSLEKTLLRGDFLFVSKCSYGPRIPNTPLSMPLVQHTMPGWLGGGRSFIEWPHWDYKRLAGLDTVRLGDIVVFNFPTGDTVALKMQNPDYYTLCHELGRDVVLGDQRQFGEIVYRPVDRRENYVKRCVGLPGDRIEIRDNQVYRNGEIEPDRECVQYNYLVQTTGGMISQKAFESMDIAVEDQMLIPLSNPRGVQTLALHGLEPVAPTYLLPLTRQNVEKLRSSPAIARVVMTSDVLGGEVFPLGYNNWTRDNYGPVRVPRRGMTVRLDSANYYLYERCIRNYENNELSMVDGRVMLNGQPATEYTFRMNYFWMMGDNRHCSADSRYWGFVPEDHVVGRPVFIWLSLDPEKSFFNGKIRWNRFLKSARQ